jgi:hypothetical protein
MFGLPLRYPSSRFTLPQSSSSGHLTQVVRNAVAGWMLCLAPALRKRSWAEAWWNALACSSSSGFAKDLSLTVKRWSMAGLVLMATISSGQLYFCVLDHVYHHFSFHWEVEYHSQVAVHHSSVGYNRHAVCLTQPDSKPSVFFWVQAWHFQAIHMPAHHHLSLVHFFVCYTKVIGIQLEPNALQVGNKRLVEK